ncbi:hypothetical protein BDW22DRAFT_1359282 [Trametopsis cervina]|nr:hypothetical protein BDW22DRAFT_1359282 [Trametopsis cervina]
MTSAVGTNTYLITRHLRSWDGRKDVFYIVLSSLIITHVPAFVLALIGIKDTYHRTTYVSVLGACTTVGKSPTLVPAWACLVSFDTLTVILSIVNALDRPRRSNADIMVYLRDDGAPFFLLVFAFRYIGLIFLIKQPATRYYLTVFLAWPLTLMTLCRFIMSNEARKKRQVRSRRGYELAEWH